MCQIGPRLLLITNRKWYIGSQLALKSMILNNLVPQNKAFMHFFGNFGLRETFQERIALRSIDKDKLHTKFSALNVDFDSPSLDFLGLRKPAYKGIKEWYPRKICYFAVVYQSCVKTVADHLGCCLSQQALMMSFLIISTSMTMKDPELPK